MPQSKPQSRSKHTIYTMFSNTIFGSIFQSKIWRITLVITVLVGLILLPLNKISTQAFVPEFQKAVNIRTNGTEDYASENFKNTVRKMAVDGVNTIALVVQYNQVDQNSSNLFPTNNTASDTALISGIKFIQSIGLKATIKIFIEPNNGYWRAMISANNRDSWFSDYTSILRKYALISQQNNLGLFNIGTELATMASPKHNPDNTRRWKEMIAIVRSIYSGKLTYGGNWGDPYNEANEIQFWGDLDYIGISAYYSLSNEQIPQVGTMLASWQNIHNISLQPLVNRWNKPIIFTEVGFRSINQGAYYPAEWFRSANFEEIGQANAFEAMFSFFDNKSYMAGMQIWDVSSDPNYGGQGNTDFTFVNKKAESTVKKWFTGSSITVPLTAMSPTARMGLQNNFSVDIKNPINNLTIGQAKDIPVFIQNRTGNNYNSIVLLEVYDSSGNIVHKNFWENQAFNAGQFKNYTINWIPKQSGVYTVRGGVFAPTWSTNLDWFETVNNGQVTIADSSSSSSKSSSIISSIPVSSAQNSSQSLGSTSSLSSKSSLSSAPVVVSSVNTPQIQTFETDIWWPTNNVVLSGVNPIKAILSNQDINSYQMFWQVDGGNLNGMYTSNEGWYHKEAWINFSDWRWKSTSSSYNINFVAKNNSGQIIAQKSVNIKTN